LLGNPPGQRNKPSRAELIAGEGEQRCGRSGGIAWLKEDSCSGSKKLRKGKKNKTNRQEEWTKISAEGVPEGRPEKIRQ